MVKNVKILRGDKYILIPIEEYLEEYHSKINDGWWQLQGYVNDAFNKSSEECSAFLKYLPKFNPDKMSLFYEKIKVELNFFEDDILRYIAFVAALGYFEKIGSPNLDTWLNAIDLNRPFDLQEEGSYNLKDLVGLKHGDNAIRNRLVSAWKVVIY